MLEKVMQSRDPGDDRSKRRRDFRITGIGPVLLVVYHVLVDFGVKCFLNLSSRARKLDNRASLRDARDLKPVRLQPSDDRLGVLIHWTELKAELGGRKPFVIFGRAAVVLIDEQLLKGRFLFRTALEDKKHPMHRQARRGRAAVELRPGERVGIVDKHRQICSIYGLGDPRSDVAGIRRCDVPSLSRSENWKNENRSQDY